MIHYLGEIISIGVAFSWTITAILSEIGSKRVGNLTLNVLRMAFALIFSVLMFLIVTGSPLPAPADTEAYLWLLLSGLVGYVIGDYCLFQSYIIIGSSFGQLLMTLAPLSAALTAWALLGQQMHLMSIVAMLVTLVGIGFSILGKGDKHLLSLKLPLRGVLFGIGAAMCQGIGLVISKQGMDTYQATMPQTVIHEISWIVPFYSNFFRCIAGITGFTLLMAWRHGLRKLYESTHDYKGMGVAVLTTLFGPFVGVGFSLMAVQYTAAGIASTLMATTPIIIIVPSYFLFKQKIRWQSIVGAVISVIGVSLFFLE